MWQVQPRKCLNRLRSAQNLVLDIVNLARPDESLQKKRTGIKGLTAGEDFRITYLGYSASSGEVLVQSGVLLGQVNPPLPCILMPDNLNLTEPDKSVGAEYETKRKIRRV